MAYKPLTGLVGTNLEILQLASVGKTNVEIGLILGCASMTVTERFKYIFEFLNVHNRAHAVAEGIRKGYIK